MLASAGFEVTVGKVDLAEVCQRAGLKTAGSAYKIWPTQEDYRNELLHHVLSEALDREAIEAVAAHQTAVSEDLPPVHELIRSSVTSALDEVAAPGTKQYQVYLALWLAAPHDPALRAKLHDSDMTLIDGYINLYESLADAYELEWKPPYDARLFATLVSALTEGLTVESLSMPRIAERQLARRLPGDKAEKAWSIAACGVYALAHAALAPREV